MEPQIIVFSAVGFADTFRLHLYGNVDSEEVLFFQPGWPDDHGAFAPLAREMAARGCLCGVSCFPSYDRSIPLKNEGFDWPEVAAHCDAAATALLGRSTRKATQVTLVLHDWGCVAGLWFAKNHSSKVKRIALLDVGPSYHPELTRKFQTAIPSVEQKCGRLSLWAKLYGFVILLHYQLWFCWCYVVNRYFSKGLARLISQGVSGLIFKSPLRYILCPVNPNEKIVRKPSEIQPFMFYVYAHFWKRAVVSLKGLLASIQAPDPSQMPTLFLYGADKNCYFHETEQLAVLQGCGQVYAGLPGGHWFYHFESRAATLKYLCDFVGVPHTLAA